MKMNLYADYMSYRYFWNSDPHWLYGTTTIILLKIISLVEGRTQRRRRYRRGRRMIQWVTLCDSFAVNSLFFYYSDPTKGALTVKRARRQREGLRATRQPSPLVAYYHAGTKKRCWQQMFSQTVSPFISHKLSLYSKCLALLCMCVTWWWLKNSRVKLEYGKNYGKRFDKITQASLVIESG